MWHRFTWFLIFFFFLTLHTVSQYALQRPGGCHWGQGIFNPYFTWIKEAVTKILLLSEVLCQFWTLPLLLSLDFYQNPWSTINPCFKMWPTQSYNTQFMLWLLLYQFLFPFIKIILFFFCMLKKTYSNILKINELWRLSSCP